MLSPLALSSLLHSDPFHWKILDPVSKMNTSPLFNPLGETSTYVRYTQINK